MKRMSGVAAAVLIALPALLFGEGGAVTVTGTVYTAGGDGTGGLVIDGSEEAYAVARDAKGTELSPLVNRKVEAIGTVSKDAFGNNVLSVSSWRVLE